MKKSEMIANYFGLPPPFSQLWLDSCGGLRKFRAAEPASLFWLALGYVLAPSLIENRMRNMYKLALAGSVAFVLVAGWICPRGSESVLLGEYRD